MCPAVVTRMRRDLETLVWEIAKGLGGVAEKEGIQETERKESKYFKLIFTVVIT